MANIGYARVSTKDQDEERQLLKLKELVEDPRLLFTERESGKNFDRAEYLRMRETVRSGDVIFLDSLDRLGRDYAGIVEEWNYLVHTVGCDVVALDNSQVFDSRRFREQGELGELLEHLMLDILAWVAQEERRKILKRQAEGIALAKRNGVYKGRKPKEVNPLRLESLKECVRRGECTVTWAAGELGISRSTWYRLCGHEGSSKGDS